MKQPTKNVKTSKKSASFHQHLVLNRWLLSLFGHRDFHALAQHLKEESLLGINQDGQTHFFEQLQLLDGLLLDKQALRRYDLNIVQHWQKITEKRNQTSGQVLQMKYFQYLSLLFTEIYLDSYFQRQEYLLKALNQTLQAYLQEAQHFDFMPYEVEDLNKLAFWSATGSGKTLLMHVNILQYLHYCPEKPEQIILLTPNEGLSRQHLLELEQSGFAAMLFDKNRSTQNDMYQEVQIIDINKLAEKNGEKTVAIESLSARNLVLIDEGHRGTSGDTWFKRREQLIGNGFAFEYSATFGQAVSKTTIIKQEQETWQKKQAKYLFGKDCHFKNLTDEQRLRLVPSPQDKLAIKQAAMLEIYAKAVIFDYSYKYFYADGYGKESQILNLRTQDYAQYSDLYFTACLLAFYQQLHLFELHRQALQPYQIEKPLWIFVGNKVADDNSDILKILQFLAHFLGQRKEIEQRFHLLLKDEAVLTNQNGENIFLGQFAPLMHYLGKETELYQAILQKLFNSAFKGRLQITLLKNTDGELALSVGNAPPFGVINIGNATDFAKTARNYTDFVVLNDEFTPSLFAKINQPESNIQLLIGSKKFTEGWSSWRVSTMGLLNMGKSEGSQIIQLFGRGVRLKGKAYSLQRTRAEERPSGLFLEKLETLNIFGIAAGYMEEFKHYLQEEGVALADEMLTVNFHVHANLRTHQLYTLRLKNGYKDNQKLGFKRQVKDIYLFEIPEKLQGKIKEIQVELDLYPKIEVYRTGARKFATDKREQHYLDPKLFAFFDWQQIYLAVWEEKWLGNWWNLRLDQEKLQKFVQQNHWYRLYIPQDELVVRTFHDIRKQQAILIDLLKLYMQRFYQTLKASYEGQFYETVLVDETHPSLQNSYTFHIDKQSDEAQSYQAKLLELKAIIEQGKLKEALGWQAPNITAICFAQHLYYPIMTMANMENLPVTMRPMDMNENSEIQFVQDLQQAEKMGRLRQWIGNKELYLLRNAANKSKGLGFALTGNFYPDFLLWLVDPESNQQWLSFIDPKGILHMGINHPKFALAEEVKKLQRENQFSLNLNAFILSITQRTDLIEPRSELEYAEKNILFMEDQDYLAQMFAKILG